MVQIFSCPPKWQSFCKHVVPHFPPFPPIFPQACYSTHTPHPPKANKKWFWGLFLQRCPHFSTKLQITLTVGPLYPHFPPIFSIFPHFPSFFLRHVAQYTPPTLPKAYCPHFSTKHRRRLTVGPISLHFSFSYFGGITCSFPEAGN